MAGRYLEEFAPGQKFASGQLKVDRERIKSFAAEFDLQPERQAPAHDPTERPGSTKSTRAGADGTQARAGLSRSKRP